MSLSTPIRRSLRTIDNFCHSMRFDNCTLEQTCLLVTLCHISGWSADRIALYIETLIKTRPLAEEVWSFHWNWIHKRSGRAKTTPQEDTIMNVVLSNANVSLPNLGSPLYTTPKPTTMIFKDEFCCSIHDDGSALVANWAAKDRIASKNFLLSNKSSNGANKPTPAEEKVFEAFGSPLAGIMRNLLKRWHKSMKCRLGVQDAEDKHTFKPPRNREQIQLIMEYLTTYQRLFEGMFGTMEEQLHPISEGEKHASVRIRSTGFAAKVFLGIIMADRIWAIVQKRKAFREAHGFLPVEVKDLSKDGKSCPICCDELGVANPEGVREEPIRVVICCHQVFGGNCLRLWLKESWKTFDRDTCPNCRFKFPQSFTEKLFKEERAKEKAKGEVVEEDSDGEGSETEGEEEAMDENGSGEEGTESTTSSSPQTPVEQDTPMENTQVEGVETVESVEAVEELLPSVEQGDDFMMEG